MKPSTVTNVATGVQKTPVQVAARRVIATVQSVQDPPTLARHLNEVSAAMVEATRTVLTSPRVGAQTQTHIATTTKGKRYRHNLARAMTGYNIVRALGDVRVGEPAWSASATWAAGDYVFPTAGVGKLVFKCTTAGAGGVTEPAWPVVVGATVVDSSATWTAESYDSALEAVLFFSAISVVSLEFF